MPSPSSQPSLPLAAACPCCCVSLVCPCSLSCFPRCFPHCLLLLPPPCLAAPPLSVPSLAVSVSVSSSHTPAPVPSHCTLVCATLLALSCHRLIRAVSCRHHLLPCTVFPVLSCSCCIPHCALLSVLSLTVTITVSISCSFSLSSPCTPTP